MSYAVDGASRARPRTEATMSVVARRIDAHASGPHDRSVSKRRIERSRHEAPDSPHRRGRVRARDGRVLRGRLRASGAAAAAGARGAGSGSNVLGVTVAAVKGM